MMKKRRANHLAVGRSMGFGLNRYEAALKEMAGIGSPSAVSNKRRKQRGNGRFSGYKHIYGVTFATTLFLVGALIGMHSHQNSTNQHSSVIAKKDKGFDAKLESLAPRPSPTVSECSDYSQNRDFGGVLVMVRFDCVGEPQGWLVIDKKESGAGSTDHSPTHNSN